MKKSAVYPLIAVLIVCVVACGILFFERQGTKGQLAEANGLLIEMTKELDTLKAEKTKWEAEKVSVGKSIGSVKTVLIDTLADLDKVTTAIGLVADISPVKEEAPASVKEEAPDKLSPETEEEAPAAETPAPTTEEPVAEPAAEPAEDIAIEGTLKPDASPAPMEAPQPDAAIEGTAAPDGMVAPDATPKK